MKKAILTLLISFSAFAATLPQTVSGVVTAINDKTIELKTDRNTLVIPKKLVKQKVKVSERTEIALTTDELQSVKIKK